MCASRRTIAAVARSEARAMSICPTSGQRGRHRSRDYSQERAEHIAPEVGAYVRMLFDLDDLLSMLRSVQAVVMHLEKLPRERAVAACLRAQHFGAHSCGAISPSCARASTSTGGPPALGAGGADYRGARQRAARAGARVERELAAGARGLLLARVAGGLVAW
jgi:hypothetical protein